VSSISELMERAAAERAHEIGTVRHIRPRERRCAERAGASAGVRMPATCELRSANADPGAFLEFYGHATTFEQGYEMYDFFGPYTEIVSAGAADATLAQTVPPLDVTLNLGHDQLRRIASTVAPDRLLSLSVDETGLAVEALALDPEDHDVRYIAPKLRSGLITEMSFAFRIEQGEWSPDYTEYRIKRFNLHRGDVAIVGYGANPTTDGALRKNATPATRAAESGLSARALLALTD
jgi:uncharacterized protein